MKKHNFAVLSVCLMIIVMITAGFASAKEAPKPVPPTKDKRVSPRDIRNRQEIHNRRPQIDVRQRDRIRLKRIDQGLDQKQKQQQRFIQELKAIKKLALQENATKTAKKLTVLIKQQENMSAKVIGDAKQDRDKFREQMAERHASSPSSQEKSKEDGEKKAKWWQFWN